MTKTIEVRLKTVSDQAAEIYKLLEESRSLTAQDIAGKLGIWPSAVYRPMNKLIDLGMVRKTNSYPRRFRALPSSAALNWYLLAVTANFKRQFGESRSEKSGKASITFITDRASLLVRTNKDAANATKSIDFIVSGLEVPDETVLAFRKAAARRVSIRAIVQQKKETTKERLEKWRGIGAEVKYLPDIGLRMFIFDAKVVYLTSYNSLDKGSAFGVRFAHPPTARQINQLFEQNWRKASELS